VDTTSTGVQLRALSERFAQQRRERQRRRHLDPADFKAIKAAGFLEMAIPVEQGGSWQNKAHSTRPIADALRTLARGDASVALVSAMHPSVLSFWLATPHVPPPFDEAWQKQRRSVFQTAMDGDWWGTITSEPGSGGDIARTRAVARPTNSGENYLLTGQKQFGSGSGVSSYMLTAALPENEDTADFFFLDMRQVPWDGSRGVSLVAEWDGHGMIATQSHGMRFENFPVTRFAWPGHLQDLLPAAAASNMCWFTAVIVGIVEVAVATAQQQLSSWHTAMRSYEQVEWAKAELEAWLVQQALEGVLRAIEERPDTAVREAMQGKMAVAELAESLLQRICRVIGGGTFSRYSPFGFWLEDVRALGFLRPPWGLAYGSLFNSSWS
jgi:alkylation response protein AidB-like acyl-CoA dehydrogenase